jgi:hypothetical protein
VEAVRDLHHQIRGLEPPVDAERPWWHLGFNLGAWAFGRQFEDAPLAGLLADLLDTCRELPDKVVATLPPFIKELTRLSPPDPAADDQVVAELAQRVNRLFQPEGNDDAEASWEWAESQPPALPDGPGDPGPRTRRPKACQLSEWQKRSVSERGRWFPAFWRSRKPWGQPPAFPFLTCWLGAAVFTLVEQLEAALLNRTKRPVWTRTPTGGVLTYDGEVVRTIKGSNRSYTIIEILVRFEANGWPTRISYPRDNVPSRVVSDELHNPLKSLRKKLTRLYFGGDETGNGIYWEVRSG